jgi:hypothetical protein
MSVTVYDYPYSGGANTAKTLSNQQFGNVTNVAADGSALTAVVFGQAYSAYVSYVGAQIAQVSNVGQYELTVQVSAVTTTGFNIYVAGGAPGATVTVYWNAIGT